MSGEVHFGALRRTAKHPGDRVLTLSTCYRGDNHQRYLVQGKLVAEAYAN